MARIRTTGVVLVAAIAVFGVFAPRGSAQAPPSITLPPLSTTTTTAPSLPPPPPANTDPGGGGTTTTAPPDGGGATTTTIDTSQDGDNGSPVGGAPNQPVPADAQAVIDAL